MRALIVDDERPARDKLRRMLVSHGGFTEVTEAGNGLDALEQIERHAPDVVFLDIQMPGISGIEVAASLPVPAPLLVFVTAYDAYAVQAFDADAIDYLLKPFHYARLARALDRVLARRMHPPVSEPGFPAAAGPVTRLLISERGVTAVVKLADVLWIETADNYVVLHTAQRGHLMRQTMTGLLQRIGPRFARCHRRAAVDITKIERIVALDKGDCELVLANGAHVPCSRQYRPAILVRLQPDRTAG
jgi:two-component system, LytTR family, response regulator